MKLGRIFKSIVQDVSRSNSFFGHKPKIVLRQMSAGSKHITKGAVQVSPSLVLPGIRRHGANQFLAATAFSPVLRRGICQTQSLQQGRGNRYNCGEWCGTDPCDLPRKETFQKPSMWISPQCYNKLICEEIDRYDIVHMPGSNKETREYQQTWVECPPLRIVPKVVCCYETKLPPICRRPRKVRPATADYCQTHNDCKIKNKLCEKIGPLPCCRLVRDPPKCKIYPSPSCCKKRCTPFPSFSECCRPDSNKKKPMECLCLVTPTQCELNEFIRRRAKY